MTSDIACRTCFFWTRQPRANPQDFAAPSRYGECRRDAPVMNGEGRGYAAWPLTLPLDWCGEHAPPVAGVVPRAAPGCGAAELPASSPPGPTRGGVGA